MMASSVDDGSPIDLHGKLAAIELLIGSLVAGIYFVFSQLGVMAALWWKLVLAAQILVSIVLFFSLCDESAVAQALG